MLDRVDIVVFSQHPDDEVIGTGGVIQQALAAGKRVRVVFSTSGDGYLRAAAALAGKSLGDLQPLDFVHLREARRAGGGGGARDPWPRAWQTRPPPRSPPRVLT